MENKKATELQWLFLSSGSWTRTSDLWVMSPTSYQLLHPAMFGLQKYGDFLKKQLSLPKKVLLPAETFSFCGELLSKATGNQPAGSPTNEHK